MFILYYDCDGQNPIQPFLNHNSLMPDTLLVSHADQSVVSPYVFLLCELIGGRSAPIRWKTRNRVVEWLAYAKLYCLFSYFPCHWLEIPSCFLSLSLLFSCFQSIAYHGFKICNQQHLSNLLSLFCFCKI